MARTRESIGCFRMSGSDPGADRGDRRPPCSAGHGEGDGWRTGHEGDRGALRYISKNGRLGMEDELGNVERGKTAVRDISEDWRFGGSLIDDSQPTPRALQSHAPRRWS